MKTSLEKLLAEARANEAAFLADIRSNRGPMSAEDRQMVSYDLVESAKDGVTDCWFHAGASF